MRKNKILKKYIGKLTAKMHNEIQKIKIQRKCKNKNSKIKAKIKMQE